MSRRILIKRDTSANWASNNPVLLEGELGLDTTLDKMKMGDGSTAWNSLSFITVADVSTLALTSQLSSYMPSSYLDTDGTLAANSDSKVASQKAVKTYVDNSAPSISRNAASGSQQYTSGSGNWACPAGVYKVEVLVMGAGGGGGHGSGGTSSGPGGGGGGSFKVVRQKVIPETNYSYSIGVGGLGATSYSSGGNGGSTTFNSIVATGGTGGDGTGRGGVGGTNGGDGCLSGSTNNDQPTHGQSNQFARGGLALGDVNSGGGGGAGYDAGGLGGNTSVSPYQGGNGSKGSGGGGGTYNGNGGNGGDGFILISWVEGDC